MRRDPRRRPGLGDRLQGLGQEFLSPIPVQSISSDEFMPGPQTQKQREFEARVKFAKRLGMGRRRFFQTAAGMAAAQGLGGREP